MRYRSHTRECAMKSADIVSREQLGETAGNLIEGVDVLT
jgi:hypothetical protein